jgi:2-dehydro-3-deoxygluconokinase
MSSFQIRPAGDGYDAIALGEVMMRIDPGDVPTRRARMARIWHGGGEVNVAEGLAACFGLKTAVVTALVDDGIGRNIENQLREASVDTAHITWFSTGGKGPFSTSTGRRSSGRACAGFTPAASTPSSPRHRQGWPWRR